MNSSNSAYPFQTNALPLKMTRKGIIYTQSQITPMSVFFKWAYFKNGV
jgi:hypothetical protein